MSIEQTWGNYFKAEVKTSGAKLVAQEKISVPSGSDTDIQAYVRVAPPFRVRLSSTDIGSDTFTADCSCPAAKKSQFCKHVWATLICVDQRYPDFLASKQVIEKPVNLPPALGEPAPSKSSRPSRPSQDDYQVAAKARAAEYRKAQYEKQKLRVKEIKLRSRRREEAVPVRAYPAEIEQSLAYFIENGFPMEFGPSAATVGEAKRKLSRVFHPDKGGSNEEIVELNEHCERLLRFIPS